MSSRSLDPIINNLTEKIVRLLRQYIYDSILTYPRSSNVTHCMKLNRIICILKIFSLVSFTLSNYALTFSTTSTVLSKVFLIIICSLLNFCTIAVQFQIIISCEHYILSSMSLTCPYIFITLISW